MNKNKYVSTNEKIELIDNKTDCMKIAEEQVDKLLFKYGIPELLYENPVVIERIVEGLQKKDMQSLTIGRVAMSPEEFMKCTSFIVATTFEDKIDLFFDMIDTDGNGLLSWDEIYDICMESLGLFAFGETNDFV